MRREVLFFCCICLAAAVALGILYVQSEDGSGYGDNALSGTGAASTRPRNRDERPSSFIATSV
jgi:hypothetical protein